MSGGWTVTPVANDSGDIVDFDIDNGYQGFRSNENDIVESNDGSRHHVFENASIKEDGEFDIDDYYTELQNSDPRIPQALEWAADNLPQDLIVSYNNALDNNDLDTVNQVLEYILNEYPGNDGEQFQDYEEQEDEPLTDEETEELSSVLEELVGNEPQGEEVALAWQEWSEQAAANGHSAAAAIAAATASFNAGECDAETAIQFVLDNYELREIEQAYRYINNQ